MMCTDITPICKVILVDRSKLFREGLKMLLHGSSFEPIDEVNELSKISQMVENGLCPDIILVALESDLRGDGNEEVAQLRRIRELLPDVRVVVLSDKLSTHQMSIALELGAEGYLLKDITPDALKQSLALVWVGEKVLPTELVRILIRNGTSRATEHHFVPEGAELSDREKQILIFLVDGYSNKRIANQLDLSEGTVKAHLKGVLKKINARNRTQAAVWALSHGLAGEDRLAIR